MPVSALAERVRRAGAGPLLTHYDLGADTRVELSARTFANWVDKTVNLIDGLGVVPGDDIALPVGFRRPDHWVSLVWVMAAWQFGSALTSDESSAALVVDGPWCAAPRSVPTVACSLHPLGLGCSTLPAGVVDYRDVLAEPDTHWVNPVPPSAIAWRDAPATSVGELAGVPARSERIMLAEPRELWSSIGTLIAALAGGSLVLVTGGTPQNWERLARSERAQIA